MSSTQTTLTDSDIAHFEEHGYVYVRNAFDASLAATARELIWRDHLTPAGIYANDSSTWPVRHGIATVFTKTNGDPWSDIVSSSRLCGAIDQLLGGNDRWERDTLGCGWWVVSFPGKEQEPWGASGKWHVDGAHFKHQLDSPEQGLLPIFLFNDLEKGQNEGGTALAAGSHKIVARLLYGSGDAGLAAGTLSRVTRELNECVGVFSNVVQVEGKAGDVCLTHPFLLHARSKNLSKREGVEGVRFMCNPCVGMHQRLELFPPVSPMENAIAKAVNGLGHVDADNDKPVAYSTDIKNINMASGYSHDTNANVAVVDGMCGDGAVVGTDASVAVVDAVDILHSGSDVGASVADIGDGGCGAADVCHACAGVSVAHVGASDAPHATVVNAADASRAAGVSSASDAVNAASVGASDAPDAADVAGASDAPPAPSIDASPGVCGVANIGLDSGRNSTSSGSSICESDPLTNARSNMIQSGRIDLAVLAGRAAAAEEANIPPLSSKQRARRRRRKKKRKTTTTTTGKQDVVRSVRHDSTGAAC